VFAKPPETMAGVPADPVNTRQRAGEFPSHLPNIGAGCLAMARRQTCWLGLAHRALPGQKLEQLRGIQTCGRDGRAGLTAAGMAAQPWPSPLRATSGRR